ncbi:hypothetical protein K438DRAFT_1132248 [Mycena galopus ATCC 62051]|nr:hypothetical protein K438DRAFT_1132248 [Mycena galopus ATCC 62051]
MLHALQITEVVEMICAELAPPVDVPLQVPLVAPLPGRVWQSCSTSQNVHGISQTGTALNLIWRHQGSVVNLLRCMPSDVWDITKTDIECAEDEDMLQSQLKIVRSKACAFYSKNRGYVGWRIPTVVDWERLPFLFPPREVVSR